MQWKVEECKSWVGSPTHELFIDMMNFIDCSKKELAYASHETTHRKQGNNFHEREPGVQLSRDRLLIIILHGIYGTSE